MITSSSPSSPSANKFISLVDGENLVFRFQAMLETRKHNSHITHFPDHFVWHHLMGRAEGWSALRANYYMSAVGTEQTIAELENKISKVVVQRRSEVSTQVCPRVFKKEAKAKKTKLVDVSITIDALRHSYHRHVDAVWLFSGDGDYLPLIREIMRNGTQVWLGAFSDGLNPALPRAVDRFIDLDPWFFA